MREPASEIIVQAKHISKQVSSPEGMLTILDDLSLQIHAREKIAIVGASGSGKSTLLGLLAGLDAPSQGHIRLLGQALTELNEDQRARLRAGQVGFVFQSFQLLPSMTALENVMLPLELAASRQAMQVAKDALDRVGLSARIHHYPSQLSGGEQQRVALARAFAIQPKILFADEPTGNLDQQTGAKIIELLFDLNHVFNTTLVLVTHDNALAEHCETRLQLASGRLL